MLKILVYAYVYICVHVCARSHTLNFHGKLGSDCPCDDVRNGYSYVSLYSGQFGFVLTPAPNIVCLELS